MKDRLHFMSDSASRIDFEVEIEAGHVMVRALFYPSKDQDVTACDTAEEAAAVMEEQLAGHFDYHSARLVMIRYRDDLSVMRLTELGRFAVPVVALAEPN